MTEDERYTVIVLNDGKTPPGVYEDALEIYRQSFGENQLTEDHEINYWRFEYNSRFAPSNDKFHMYALSDRGITCGFAMIAYMADMKVLIVDYFVIKEAHRRGLFAFTAFYRGIKQHFHNYQVDYAVAEIDVDQESYDDSEDLWHIFRWVNFRVVDMDYRSAPMTDNPLEPVKLALWSAHEYPSLRPDELSGIIHSIFEWNKRWCEPTMTPEEFSEYYMNFKARLAHDEYQLSRSAQIQILELA